jgi:hypothetical protein
MRLSNYGAAALGITRIGQEDGRIVRTISMAGFNAYSPVVSNKWCDVGTFDAMPKDAGYTAYCDCMYPPDIAAAANAECKNYRKIFGIKVAPWSVLANVPQDVINTAQNAASDAAKQGATAALQQGAPAAAAAAAAIGINLPILTAEQAAEVARSKSDQDLIALIDGIKADAGGSAPDPTARPDQAILYAGFVAENNYRAANPCGSGRRDYSYGIDADGRLQCGGRAIGMRFPVRQIPFDPGLI